MSAADKLRAQVATSTDPARLEREARRAERVVLDAPVGDDVVEAMVTVTEDLMADGVRFDTFTLEVVLPLLRELQSYRAGHLIVETTPPNLAEWKRIVNDAYFLLADPREDAVWTIDVNEWLRRAVSLASRVKASSPVARHTPPQENDHG